jgi:hypothetical protein
MITTKTIAFIRQPSTVLGLSALVGALTALLTGEITWQNAAPAIAGALAAIALPDNSGARSAIKDATVAVIAAEQAAVNTPAKPTSTVGVTKVTATTLSLLAAGLTLSACAVQPTMHVRAVADLRVAYAAAHAAETAYAALPGAVPAITAQLAMLDEKALAALTAYDVAPDHIAPAQAAEMAVAALAAYSAARATR